MIYRAKDGRAELEVKLQEETVWLDAHQMAVVFDIDRTVIVKHINNIYKEGELKPNSTCAIFAQVHKDSVTVCSNSEHTAQDGKIYQI